MLYEQCIFKNYIVGSFKMKNSEVGTKTMHVSEGPQIIPCSLN